MLRPSKEERLKYKVDYAQDTEFSAFARLLQSKWRERKGYPATQYGNFIDADFAKVSKVNFLTANIQELVTKEIHNARISGGLIGQPRIWHNLLSSQPLCFNLFGELHYDLELATIYFQRLFPDKIDKVTAVRFEYSPGRGDSKYIGDHSAFDVFVEYTKGKHRGFIGIEVKYAESLREETKLKAEKNYKERYATVTEESGIFINNSVPFLRQPPLSQIWRDHLLSIATKQDYDEGFFVFLFPSGNTHCQAGVDNYRKYLANDLEEENGFCPRYLEDFINALADISIRLYTRIKITILGRWQLI
ncbi:MAG: hypothetical protein EOO43_02875 [Flavobacterium sp.]|nr:MAG: hypothetical protein EOO43_02875 [Flavobacterium sp.]